MTIYVIIRYAKEPCKLCKKFLNSISFKALVFASAFLNEKLEVIDLNADIRAERFYRLFPSESITLPAIVKGKTIIKRADSLHYSHLLSLLFGDVSQLLVALEEGKEIQRKQIKKVRKILSDPISFRVFEMAKRGYTLEEICKQTNLTEKKVKEIIKLLKQK